MNLFIFNVVDNDLSIELEKISCNEDFSISLVSWQRKSCYQIIPQSMLLSDVNAKINFQKKIFTSCTLKEIFFFII